MSIIIIILLVLGGIIALLFILPLFMKKKYAVKSEIIIDVPVQKAYGFLKLLNNQDKFNKWAKADPNRKWEYKGIDGTVGYIIAWKGNKDAGEGEKEIVNLVEGKRIESEIRFIKPMRVTASVIMETESLSAHQTKVALINAGKLKYPMNLMIPMAEKKFPKDMNESLVTLKEILEK